MKIKILLLSLLIVLGFNTKAQYITIPDTTFASWLNINIPAAMIGNQMDTTHSDVTTLISMDVSMDTIRNLSGVHYFTSLEYLNCSFNKLTDLPLLPSTLQILKCNGNYITDILSLPSSILIFECYQNQLDSLPVLPLSMTHFYCENNLLTSMPLLPDSVITMDCSGNQLTSLPVLPPSLDTLDCGENQLTSLPSLPSTLQSIYCDHNPFTSLPALPSSLKFLNCESDSLTSLPSLPSGLITLECGINFLTALPVLPASLVKLICGMNLLTSLPSLPASLETLECYNNQLPVLPALPASLQYLNCSFNPLPTLPVLSGSLITLICNNDQLSSLPALPGTLETLECSYNSISLLPALPGSLQSLSCGMNPLIDLPALPINLFSLLCQSATLDSLPALPSFLSYLDCQANSLTILPSLPSGLNMLNCNNNLLTSLPSLPASITELHCHSNNINCFDEFPFSLGLLYISSNPFSCLPNYIPAMDASILLYPLCVSGDFINNPSGCVAAEGVVGFTYTDMNTNCMKDTLDGNLTNIPVRLFDSAGVFLSQTYTAINGVYHFPESNGTYEVRVDTSGMPISPQCPSPGADTTVSVTTSDPLITDVNFDFGCKPGFDIGVRSISHCGLVFPGQAHQLRVDAGDMTQWYNMACAEGMSGQVQMTITGPVSFSSIAAGALTPVITGNVYTYSIADFGSIINTQAFGLILIVDPTAGSGNQICVEIDVTPAGGDNDSTNNSFNFCYEVVNSHDPNIKETYPQTVPLNYDEWFTYTIQFQNTGTAPAINIHLRDTLDNLLDLSTFEAIGYSHKNYVMLSGNALMIQFPDIYLSDSTSSSDSSKGFFQYRIKPLSGLGCGTQIHNTASIYFDYNAPVVTNTTVNSYPQSPITSVINDTTVCHSSSLTLNVPSTGNTMQWYDAGNSLLYTGNNYTISNVTSNTTLYMQSVNASGCDGSLEEITISVLPLAASPLLSSTETLCFTETLFLSASSVAGWNYHWSGPSGFISSVEDPTITPLSQNNSGTYSLYISNGQCVSDTAQVLIHIDLLPTLFINSNPSICLGDSVILYAAGNINSVTWATGETDQMIIVSPTETNLYWVNGTNTCGTVTQNILVTVNIPPVAIAENAILIVGESTPLHAAGGTQYSWYPDNGLSCTNCQDPLLTITEGQFYNVIVTDINGCIDTANLKVTVVKEESTVYIPNSFSPNSDGMNDEFKVTGIDIKNVQMSIYGRSGDKLFESNDMNAGWDGTFKGKMLSPLVYVYTAIVTMHTGEERKFKGSVTLIR